MADVRFYRGLKTGRTYKTGGPYKDQVWVLLIFGWIISTQVALTDLVNEAEFSEIAESEI